MIPPWTRQGVIPPMDATNPASAVRAPYQTTVTQVVERFATSERRCEILQGFLDHRSLMHHAGIAQGFQWLNGSFMENVELTDNRPPNDMDVVTYASWSQATEASLTPEQVRGLTDNPWIKRNYLVDFYLISLSDPAESLIEISAYWYSMWSHRRSMQWKGFLSVRLEPDHDAHARDMLLARRLEIQNEQN